MCVQGLQEPSQTSWHQNHPNAFAHSISLHIGVNVAWSHVKNQQQCALKLINNKSIYRCIRRVLFHPLFSLQRTTWSPKMPFAARNNFKVNLYELPSKIYGSFSFKALSLQIEAM